MTWPGYRPQDNTCCNYCHVSRVVKDTFLKYLKYKIRNTFKKCIWNTFIKYFYPEVQNTKYLFAIVFEIQNTQVRSYNTQLMCALALSNTSVSNMLSYSLSPIVKYGNCFWEISKSQQTLTTVPRIPDTNVNVMKIAHKYLNLLICTCIWNT